MTQGLLNTAATKCWASRWGCKPLLQIAVLSQLALHAGADSLRPVTPLVRAPLLLLSPKTSCIKQVVDQCPWHSVQCYVTKGFIEKSAQHTCLASPGRLRFFWYAAHFPVNQVHKLSCAFRLTMWEWSFMLTACAMNLCDSLLCRQLWLVATSNLYLLQCQLLHPWLPWRSGQLQAAAQCHVLLTSAARSDS